MELNEHEQRALGVLIEKQLSTPDQYPLSLNALRAGCNQKSNRDPVSDYSEAELIVGVQGLEAKGLALRTPAGMGSRVERYEHCLEAKLAITDKQQMAVLAELLVRGAQAPGELRQRASRMRRIGDLAELGFLLDKLAHQRLVQRVAPASGSRAERWGHTFGLALPASAAPPVTAEQVIERHGQPEPASPTSPADPVPHSHPPALDERVARLERQLQQLAEQLGVDLGG